MAKKKSRVRRVPRSVEPRMFGNGKPSKTPQPERETSRPSGRPAEAPARNGAAESRVGGVSRVYNAPRSPASLAQDYRYVLNDLRRLGILAAATFAVLIILGFVIR
jgi:hypothetical protein